MLLVYNVLLNKLPPYQLQHNSNQHQIGNHTHNHKLNNNLSGNHNTNNQPYHRHSNTKHNNQQNHGLDKRQLNNGNNKEDNGLHNSNHRHRVKDVLQTKFLTQVEDVTHAQQILCQIQLDNSVRQTQISAKQNSIIIIVSLNSLNRQTSFMTHNTGMQIEFDLIINH